MKTLPIKLQAAEQQRDNVYEALLTLTERVAALEGTLEVIELGLVAPKLVADATELSEKIRESLEGLQGVYISSQISLESDLRVLRRDKRLLSGVVGSSELIESSLAEIDSLVGEEDD